MKYFGIAWNPNIASMIQSPTPVGEKCVWCDESIKEGDDGLILPCLSETISETPYHQECFLRTVVGSLAHQQKRCSCFGGSDEEDSPNVSLREAAVEAVKFYHQGIK